MLACPDDNTGLVRRELDEGNAAGARKDKRPVGDIGALYRNNPPDVTPVDLKSIISFSEVFDAASGVTQTQNATGSIATAWTGAHGMVLSPDAGTPMYSSNGQGLFLGKPALHFSPLFGRSIGATSSTDIWSDGSYPYFAWVLAMQARGREIGATQPQVFDGTNIALLLSQSFISVQFVDAITGDIYNLFYLTRLLKDEPHLVELWFSTSGIGFYIDGIDALSLPNAAWLHRNSGGATIDRSNYYGAFSGQGRYIRFGAQPVASGPRCSISAIAWFGVAASKPDDTTLSQFRDGVRTNYGTP